MPTLICNKKQLLEYIANGVSDTDVIVISAGIDGNTEVLSKRKILRVQMSFDETTFTNPIASFMRNKMGVVSFIYANPEAITEQGIKLFNDANNQ